MVFVVDKYYLVEFHVIDMGLHMDGDEMYRFGCGRLDLFIIHMYI